MFLYIVLEAVIGIIAGILIAACTKKADGVTYGKLDKACRITNVILFIVYVCLSPLCMFLGMVANPRYDGFLGVLGWIVAIIMGLTSFVCSVGLGLSVAFRKKGKRKQSFAVQFAGLGAIVLMFILFFVFYGNLLKPLN